MNIILKYCYSVLSALVIFAIIISSCSPNPTIVPVDDRIGALPKFVIDPIDNPTTTEKVELGRILFWDPILSGNFDVACATCHHPAKGWSDNLSRSVGVGGKGFGENRKGGEKARRNSLTIINTAFNGIDVNGKYDPSNSFMFWDNQANSLEEQSLIPIKNISEMRGEVYSKESAISIVSQRLMKIPKYITMFKDAFGDNTEIDGDKISKAIAAFERSIVANNSRFDQYARGDIDALSSQEIRGLNAFIEMKCTACHGGPMFSDYKLHDLGVPENGNVDNGVNGKFRTSSLRNLSITGPYMHNGAFSTLNQVVLFYATFERNDDDARQLNFNRGKVNAVVAFLRALNDDHYDKTVPENVPSGLPVGGDISN